MKMTQKSGPGFVMTQINNTYEEHASACNARDA